MDRGGETRDSAKTWSKVEFARQWPGTTEAGEKLWRLRRRNSVDCRGFMYAACIRARAQRDLSALGRVSVGQVEWIVNVSGRTSPRWRPPPGASLFTPHGSPRGKSSMARVENSNPRIHYQFHGCFFYQSPRNFANCLSFHNEFFLFSLSRDTGISSF